MIRSLTFVLKLINNKNIFHNFPLLSTFDKVLYIMEEIKLEVNCPTRSGQYSTCKLFAYGAHITSWIINNSTNIDIPTPIEQLWMSSISSLDGKAPIRGGIPIAFPQFADNGKMKLHGFARENIWILKEHIKTNISDKVILNLPITKNIKTEWDFPWDCELNIEI